MKQAVRPVVGPPHYATAIVNRTDHRTVLYCLVSTTIIYTYEQFLEMDELA